MFHNPTALWANYEIMSACPAIVLAGGQGSRLHELTENDSKPALRFGNHARIVDFAFGNAFNSGVSHVMAATQYRPQSLHRRLQHFWKPFFKGRGGDLDVRFGPRVTGTEEGYIGTAAAVASNIARIDAMSPEHVLILAADHIYRMNYADMMRTHRASGADMTVAAAAVPCEKASGFGIIDADANGRITDFLEKPAAPPPMKNDPGKSLASMGVYIFRWAALREVLISDMSAEDSTHDFGFDVVPQFVSDRSSVVHLLESPVPETEAYWRDVGTLDAYREAHLDLTLSQLQDAGRRWPILPAALDGTSILGTSVVSSEQNSRDIERSFIASHSLIGSSARISGSVLMQGTVVGASCRLHNCILASGTVVEPGTIIGADPEEDAQWFRRSPEGTTLVTSQMLAARRRGLTDKGHRAKISEMEPL
ncbi:MAG: sugar phosphate nucleotidyltransferase [Rhodobacterales bacterium]|nr:sugar phosphate nucleotidyltransferase [Rhodobacterales bacterium]